MRLVLLASTLILLVSQAVAVNEVKVVAKSGPVVGETITAEYRPISRFFGVPYAQPPIGKLRFRKPRPVQRWDKPVEALHWPKNCFQNLKHPFNSITKPLIITDEVSEDCLYLNIWSTKIDVTDESKLKPVIVWFHGGALLLGSSALEWYNGETLAARADAVVVTVNYRLSGLGFMYSDEVEDVKGNQGLWDQAMALEWIQENIRYFGGNPSQVTIMGESAGGWSVSLQVLSPVSRNLFHNGVIMSGAATNDRVVIEPKEAVKRLLKGIRQVGCATEQDKKISKKVVECLEKLEPEKVDAIGYLVSNGLGELPPLVVVDGEFLTDKPIELLKKGDYKTDVNLLVDTVKDEGNFMFLAADPKFKAVNPDKINLKEAKEIFFKMLLDNFPNKDKFPKEAISKLYFDKLNPYNEDSDVYRRQVGIAFGDMQLGCPTIQFAKQVFANSPKTAKVYQWHYTAKLGKTKILEAKYSDTTHTNDIYAVFGSPFRNPKWYQNRERDISREVIQIIASFARTGEPGATHSEWQRYFLSPDGKDVIAPYYEIGNQYQTSDSYKYNLKQVECDMVWNKLMNY